MLGASSHRIKPVWIIQNGLFISSAKNRACFSIMMRLNCELHNEVSFKAHLAIGYEETGRSIHFRKSLLTF